MTRTVILAIECPNNQEQTFFDTVLAIHQTYEKMNNAASNGRLFGGSEIARVVDFSEAGLVVFTYPKTGA